MTKKCRTCEFVKDYSEFHINRNTIDGLQYICKECTKEKNRKYRIDAQLNLSDEEKEQNRIIRNNKIIAKNAYLKGKKLADDLEAGVIITPRKKRTVKPTMEISELERLKKEYEVNNSIYKSSRKQSFEEHFFLSLKSEYTNREIVIIKYYLRVDFKKHLIFWMELGQEKPYECFEYIKKNKLNSNGN